MKFLKFAVAAVACAQPVLACDLCAIYSASEAHGEIGKGPYVGVAQQFTHFATWQVNGREVRNEPDEYLDSSITQVLLGLNFTDRFGMQVNIPMIHRSYRRLEGHHIARGAETGPGDVSILAHFQAYRRDTRDTTLSVNLLGGLKLPTGDSSRLHEEVEHHEAIEHGGHEHPNGIHGHDLALGSGSYDGIVGANVYARWRRLYFSGSAQYSIRTKGDHHFEYADDLLWSGGPGALLALSEEFTLSLQANISGENKGRDTFRGEKAADTGITSVFAGPQLTMTWQNKLTAELGFDLPVFIDNTALQIVPDYRLRAALVWRF